MKKKGKSHVLTFPETKFYGAFFRETKKAERERERERERDSHFYSEFQKLVQVNTKHFKFEWPT